MKVKMGLAILVVALVVLVNLDYILWPFLMLLLAAPALAVTTLLTLLVSRILGRTLNTFEKASAGWHPPILVGRLIAVAGAIAAAFVLREGYIRLSIIIEDFFVSERPPLFVEVMIGLFPPAVALNSVFLVFGVGMMLWEWALRVSKTHI